MQRLFTLVDACVKTNEPVILVGETGCGKTTICSVISNYYERQLRTVNCHLHTEASDFLGGLRPIRGRSALQAQAAQLLGVPLEMPLTQMIATYQERGMATEELDEIMTRLATFFEWANGPLIDAMIEGDIFLIDEISLADESVLERLNSVLEPSRQLLLSEKGGLCSETITAADSFKILATMNPGGDYGKKELSLAMKNRFTEIWVELCQADIASLIQSKVSSEVATKMIEFL